MVDFLSNYEQDELDEILAELSYGYDQDIDGVTFTLLYENREVEYKEDTRYTVYYADGLFYEIISSESNTGYWSDSGERPEIIYQTLPLLTVMNKVVAKALKNGEVSVLNNLYDYGYASIVEKVYSE